ncbi:MAG: alkaline phosphatase family protein [Blastocatellia bacterium]|nr:alkaline phosphatase family protein [Blastocatellia bacterium]
MHLSRLFGRYAAGLLVLGLLTGFLPNLAQNRRVPPTASTALKVTGPAKPKLILTIVVDQFRNDYLSRFGDLYSENGFQRLVKNGAYFTNAHYLHACTYTACGHAVILSGSVPAMTGIIGNQWFERESGLPVTSVTDARFMGLPSGRGGAPTRLLVTTLGDQMRMNSNYRSKVIGISLKDRSAMLPVGKSANAAYWFDTAGGNMQTSAYYMDSLPPWVTAFNARKYADSYFGKTWERLLPEAVYNRSDRDDAPYEGKFAGDSNKFPHVITGGGTQPGPKYYDDFTKTPWANDLQVDFAEAAIENEQLGQDDDTDLLSVSFSAFDILGHAFGPFSQEMEDMALRTDLAVARLLDVVDKKVGLANTLVVFTADHGAAPVPEYAQEKKMGGRRIKELDVMDAVTKALNAAYGQGTWISDVQNGSVYLNLETIQAKKLDRSTVERLAGETALKVPGVATYFTRTQMLNGPLPPTEIARRVAAAFHPHRSGDVYLVPEPYSFFEEPQVRLSTTHGTPYSYDTHVPVILMGRGLKPGQYQTASSPADIAPTLATLLNVEAPSGTVGRVLNEALETEPLPAKALAPKAKGRR